MAGRLVNALGSSALAVEAFSDLATLRHMLRFEAALAQAAAEAGLIPKKFAPIIVKACDPALYDPASLAEAARRTATLTVPVVKALTDEVAKRDADAAGYVHWGATSQDVIDTAMVLQLGEALPPIVKELAGIVASFAALARKHRKTPMLGRTLLQPATPLALGQKIAGWASDVSRATRRLEASFAETQIVQFGGASGSLSALGDKAEPVMIALAERLGLMLPPAPWFTQRVRVAALGHGAVGGRKEIVNRVLVAGANHRALKLSGQKTRPPVGRTVGCVPAAVGNDHERRQILVQGAEAVADPRTETGPGLEERAVHRDDHGQFL